jgi:hypothetical protein
MPGWLASRTFSAVVLRTVGLRVLVFAVAAGFVLVGQALAVDASARPSSVPVEQVVQTPPVWTTADAIAYPGCVALSAWPTGQVAPFVVVQRVREGGHHRLGFDRAWRLNHNASGADDVWVLGVCGDR